MRLDSRALATLAALITMAATPTAARAVEPTLAMKLSDRTLAAGQDLELSGHVPQAVVGTRMAVEYRARGEQHYEVVEDVPLGPDGSWALRVELRKTGAVRVAIVQPGAERPSWDANRSLPRAVTVAAATPVLKLTRRVLDVRLGSRATVAGRAGAASVVRLQGRVRGRWTTLDVARVRGGRFVLRARPARTGSMPVRVRAGRRAKSAGRLDVYRWANASWYGPGFFGNRTGCGGRLYPGTLGVAHKTLPCGTKVTFRRGGRSITVRVIDRGPYVGSREYDLTAATARALGFSGHGPLLATR